MPQHHYNPGPRDLLTTQDYAMFEVLLAKLNELREELGMPLHTTEEIAVFFTERYAALRRGSPPPAQ
jgi:hypothetical protein